MLLNFGSGVQAPVDGSGRQRRWTIWGQGDLQAFRGTPEGLRGCEGDLRSGYVGVDALAGRRWLLGVAVGRGGGRGTWQAGASDGRLRTTLTTVYPYLRWGSGDTTVWAVAGAGRGTASLLRTAVAREDASPLRLALGLLEGRRRLATVGRGLRIGLRGEASAARLATGEGETIDRLRAGVRRLRGGIELTQDLDGPGGSTLTPFGAVSARHDGGAGQTGLGLEVAGGVRLRGGRLQVEVQGRRLVLHSAAGYSDHGVSLAASVGAGAYQPGLTLMVRPTWGAVDFGANTLWQDHFQLSEQGVGHDEAGMDAQVGYGLRLPKGGLLEPFGGFGHRQGLGRRLQLGARIGALDRIPGLFGGPLQLELAGERYDRPGATPDHRFSMVGVIDFGPRPAKPTWTARTTSRSRTRPPASAPAAPAPPTLQPQPAWNGLVDHSVVWWPAAPTGIDRFAALPGALPTVPGRPDFELSIRRDPGGDDRGAPAATTAGTTVDEAMEGTVSTGTGAAARRRAEPRRRRADANAGPERAPAAAAASLRRAGRRDRRARAPGRPPGALRRRPGRRTDREPRPWRGARQRRRRGRRTPTAPAVLVSLSIIALLALWAIRRLRRAIIAPDSEKSVKRHSKLTPGDTEN